jgi:2-phospho-L-lactate guanylyltransferase
MTVFAVIPVKKLDGAKSRLSPLLTSDERKQFCLKMLEDVLRSVKSTRRINQTVVVSRDPAVLQTAKTFDAAFLKERKTGLNQAVSEAIDWCVEKGATSVLILPADIPLVAPTDLDRLLTLGERASMVISPSRSGKGTNALLLTPPNASPTFYGPHSFQRHIEEASKRRISLSRLRSPRIALDIDTEEDIKDFVLLNARETSAYKLLDKMGVPNKLGIRSRK